MIFFTSDQHYDHANIIIYSKRPYENVHYMREDLIARHNARVSKDDVVYHVGDFAMNEKTVPVVLARLNGKHRLVAGNHDKCHAMRTKCEQMKRKYISYGFLSVDHEIHLDEFVLNHLPYSGDSGKAERFPEWRPKDEGKILLHGHVHEHWSERGRMINVGVDVRNYAPISIDEIRAIAAGITA